MIFLLLHKNLNDVIDNFFLKLYNKGINDNEVAEMVFLRPFLFLNTFCKAKMRKAKGEKLFW